MLSGRVLLAHHPAEVCPALTEGLAPVEVCWVPDGFMATAEVAARPYDAILVQHPLGEMDAFMLSSWLRASGATCPILVIADGASEEEIGQLGRQLDEGCTIVGAAEVSVVRAALEMVMGGIDDAVAVLTGVEALDGDGSELEGFGDDGSLAALIDDDVEEEPARGEIEEIPALVSEGLDVGIAGEEALVATEVALAVIAPAPASAPVAEPALPPILASFLSRHGTERASLKSDLNTKTLLGMFRLPDALTSLLDGSRSVCAILNDCRMPSAIALDAMMRLDEAGCLALTAARPERPAAAAAVALRQELELPEGPADEVMAASPFQMPELLLGLRHRQRSGTAVIEGRAFSVQLTLDRGRLLAARGGPPDTGLGQVLVSMGKLDADTLDRLTFEAARNPDVKLEDIAVRLGWVNAAYVHAALSTQMDLRIAALLPLDGALCRFYAGRTAADGGIEARPVETVVAEWLGKGSPRAVFIVRRFIHWEQRTPVRAREGAHELLPLLRLGARGQRLIGRLDGRPLREILDDGVMPKAEVGVALYLLWAAGGLEVDARPALSTERESPAPAAPRVEPLPSSPPNAPAMGAAAAGPGDGRPPAEAPARPRIVERFRPPSGAPPAAPAVGAKPASEVPDLQELLRKGRDALDRKDLIGAHAALQTARALAPEDPAVLVALATATFRRAPGSPVGRAEARLLLTQALTRDENVAEAYLMLGKMSRLEGDFAGARRHFQRAMSIDPENRDALGEVAAMDRLEKRVTKDVEEESDAPATGGIFGFFKRGRK